MRRLFSWSRDSENEETVVGLGDDGRRELSDLFAQLSDIEPSPAARTKGRAKLRAALITARAAQSRPRLAGVRGFVVAVAGLAASAATGTGHGHGPCHVCQGCCGALNSQLGRALAGTL